MNILQLNNYHYLRGGSERYYFEVSELLKKKGHNVCFFSVNDCESIKNEYSKYFAEPISFDKKQGFLKKIKTAVNMLYNFNNQKKMYHLLNNYKIDIAHAHNIYHRISPSVLVALNRKKIPVVMTLHDYKLGCPVYSFYRENIGICVDCLNKGKYSVVLHNCTKGSYIYSFFHYLESSLHKLTKIYVNNINMFICPSLFSVKLHQQIGIPQNKLIHIPNFVNIENFDPEFKPGDYILYVGRLSKEKGVITLLRAVKDIGVKLKIVGDGPIKHDCERFVSENEISNVEFVGYKSGEELKQLYRNSAFLIMPSEWYENAPMTILESFAYGKPMIGSKIGGIPEMIIDGETGFLFEPANENDLREKILYFLSKPSLIEQMGKNARLRVEREYNAEIHYNKLIEVYKRVL